MDILSEVVALFVCLGPIVALVGWLMWLSRRPGIECPNCSRKVAYGTRTCPSCGTELPPEQVGQEQETQR